MDKKHRKKHLKLTVVFIINAILFLVLVSMTIAIYSIIHHAHIDRTLTYAYKTGMTYEGCIKENEFIDSECHQDKRSYVADLLEKVKINYNYEAASSILVGYDYQYEIVATLVATEYNDPAHVLYTKTDVLKQYKDTKINVNSMNEEAFLEIDYQHYNELIKSFKKNYSVPLSAKLNVYVNTSIIGTTEEIKSHVELSNSLQLSIPLGEQTVSIEETNIADEKEENVKIKYYPHNTPLNNNILKFSSILAFMQGFIVIIIMIKLFPRLHSYNRDLKHILRTYDNAIVIVKNAPDMEGLVSVEVDSFVELLDAKENLNQPIVCYKNDEKKTSVFMCASDKNVFYYVLSADKDDKHDKKKR